MRVVYDYQIFLLQQYGGISRYFCALADRLSRLRDTSAKVIAPLHANLYLKDLQKELVAGRYAWQVPRPTRAQRLANAGLFVPMACIARPNIVHETYYSKRPTYSAKVPHVLTVYDMIHELFPKDFSPHDPTAMLKEAAVRRADHVFCISENTKNDVLRIYRVPEDRVSVTYLDAGSFSVSSFSAKDLVGEKPFLLYVGARRGYKNFMGLIRAYANSTWLKDTFRVVCFGGGAFSPAEHTLMHELGLNERHLLQLGGSDDRLAALYKAAAAFVYPSKYEGFGIPPLEAMSFDCPVICSRSSSIPEVVGSAGEYFVPDDQDSIRHALDRVLGSSSRRSELVQFGRARRNVFSWERCAKESHDAYRRLAG